MKGIRGRIAVATALGAAALLAGVAMPATSGAATSGTATSGAATSGAAATRTAGTASDTRPPATSAAAIAAARVAARDLPGVCGPPYVRGRRELGPKVLPRTGYFGSLVRGYVRYGGLTPDRFTFRYWDASAQPPFWRYPPDLGFAHSGGWSNGRVLRSRTTLAAGSLADRFGSPYGAFLAPGGTSFGARALPPDSLDTRTDDPAHLCNYHLYRVSRAFDVDAGPIAPAFQQPGGGLQYLLMSAYVPQAPTPLNVRWLVDNGYLSVIY